MIFPERIRRLEQWVCASNGSKVPMRACERVAASSTDPRTWCSFDVAYQAVSDGIYDYCGFVFNNNGIVGIDIDNGFDQCGRITTVAADIIGRCRSYTERSKSGRGFHVLVGGDLPFKGRNNLAGVEIYKAARFFIMTGDTLTFRDIVDNQEAVDYVLEKYFRENLRDKGSMSCGKRIYSPIWQQPEKERVRLRPVYPDIPCGCRNVCLTSLAGTLHNVGYSKKQIFDELVFVNSTACKPPLDNRELWGICGSVVRYKRR